MTDIHRILRAVERTPWAIQPEKLEVISGILIAKAQSGQIPNAQEIEALEARQRSSTQRVGGIAVLPLVGTISRRMSLLGAMSGGASVETFMREFDEAVADDSIGAIVNLIDSPGGGVFGVPEAARKIREARDKKRIITVVDGGLMASAGYWLGAAAGEVVITEGSEVGSVGVYTMHFDWSENLALEGIKATIIKAGEHKAEGNPYEPLSEDARTHFQSQVNDYYDLFIDAAARSRGVSRKVVLESYGQGRTLTAKRALAAGMVDRISTLDQVMEELKTGKRDGVRGRSAVAVQAVTVQAPIAASEAADPAGPTQATLDRAVVAVVAALGHVAAATGALTEGAPEGATIRPGGAVQAQAMAPPGAATAPPGATATEIESAAAGGAAAAKDGYTPDPQPAPGAKEHVMGPTTDNAAQQGAVEAAIQAERKRAADVRRMGRDYQVDATKVEQWIDAGLSVEQVQGKVLEEVRARAANQPAITVGADREAERPFASLGEQLIAIRNAGARGGGGDADRRLLALNDKYVAAMGSASNVPADGGFVIQADFTRGVVSQMWDEGRVLSRTNRVPIGESSNALVRNRIKGNSRKDGKRYGGVRVYRVAESGTVEGSKPEVERQRIELEKLMGIYYATEEILQDAVALTAEAEKGFRSELTFVSENEVFRGTGAGQALGFLTSKALVVVAKEGSQAAATINVQNVSKMMARLPARSFATAAWYINPSCIPQLVTMTLGDQPVFLPGGNAAGARFGTLFGLPIEPAEYCEALGTQGDIVLADLSQYTTIDKRGVTWQESIHVRFIHDETAFKLTYRFNGQPDWPEAVEPFKGSDKISPFIALATRS